MTITSFGSDLNVAVFGASGGIGSALARALRGDPTVSRLTTVSRGGDTDLHCDYHDEDSIAQTAEALTRDGPLHLALIATGILHGGGVAPEKTWKHLDAETMAEVLAINTIVPTMLAKHLLPKLARDRKSVFAALSARVGSIGDNRLGGWLSYRASKAALNMAIRTLSIELTRVNPDAIILGLHPGTVETGLSKPFRSTVDPENLFTPEHAASRLIEVIDHVDSSETGHVLAYDGSRIPP